MNREDVFGMALEAANGMLTYDADEWRLSESEVKRFAELVAAAEREACAEVYRAMISAAPSQPAGMVPNDAALLTLARMFHSSEEIEGDDGAAMMVGMALWNEGFEALESILGNEAIIDAASPAQPAAPAVPDCAIRSSANALLHQIDIGDFVDSNGHSAKMLKAVHDLMRALSAAPAEMVPPNCVEDTERGLRLVGPHGGVSSNIPNPTDAELASPVFEAIWQATKTWDVNVPEYYKGYCGMNGSHVAIILRALVAAPAVERKPLTERELELIDGMIEVQLHHARQCDGIANRVMADKQKGWDMERVALLRKLRGITQGAQ